MDIKLPKYEEWSAERWKAKEQYFDEWIEMKYKYCVYHCLKTIKEQLPDNKEEKDTTFIYPMLINVIMEKNSFSEDLRYRVLDEEKLFKSYKLYCSLVAEINKYTFFLPSKQTFCQFINVPVQLFNDWGKSGTSTSAVIEMINDYFTTTLAYAGQSGAAKTSTINLMLKAEESGQGIMTAKESKTSQFTQARLSMDDIQKKLESLN